MQLAPPRARLGYCLGERACPRRWADGINRNCGGHDGTDATLTERMQAIGIDMTTTPGRHDSSGSDNGRTRP